MLGILLAGAFIVLLMALLFGVIRLYQGPSVVDRIIVFDLFVSIAIGLMGVGFLWLKDTTLIDIALLLSVISFVGTLAFAKHLEDSKS